MAIAGLIPLSEYVGHSFEPDCDYVDGALHTRNWCDGPHSDVQAQLLQLLYPSRPGLGFRVYLSLRVQVAPSRIRVVDLVLLRQSAPREQITTTAPLLCIEVLSPEDGCMRMHERVRDYLDMGVREVWVVNPESRSVMIFAGAGMMEHSAGEIAVPETPVTLAIADIFKVLDEY